MTSSVIETHGSKYSRKENRSGHSRWLSDPCDAEIAFTPRSPESTGVFCSYMDYWGWPIALTPGIPNSSKTLEQISLAATYENFINNFERGHFAEEEKRVWKGTAWKVKIYISLTLLSLLIPTHTPHKPQGASQN